ncbi:formate--tetrahydrofolate ligase [Arcanobacterium urinimassiliense]|uniref:formate--tetrahydrofolate ligase n=1 Tax=Arcanobacterium urinimassiliense TaxID=1871014 RepID=UPI00093BE19C|nr:formate--tetrahydrofolate ligase [Arcanobacterium urinimassiliense]
MAQLSDIEIAQQSQLRPITEIAAKLGIDAKYLVPYGRAKAKLDLQLINDEQITRNKLVLVTAMSPTPAGEGKTTTTIGLADGLAHIGKRVCAALREPSLGPVFGLKGGACGGGYAQVLPMEDINLHFTGDFHAISAANNLLAALLDNHIYQGNELRIDPQRIVLKRCLDMNDRQLRNIVDGRGKTSDGREREDGFEITVATEVMAIFCLASSLADLKRRLGKIIVAYNEDGKPVTAADLQAAGAMTALLREALLPNLVQSIEGTPVIMHGGPFANIAHGCNSIIATKMARSLSSYTVTEAGFGADLGAEKFIDIKCRLSGMQPDCAVVVGTIRALKMHGGVDTKDLEYENLPALQAGLPNLLRHISTLQNVFNLPVVVALNVFPSDTAAEIALASTECAKLGVKLVNSTVWADGGAGGEELAQEVVRLCEENKGNETGRKNLDLLRFAYPLGMPIAEKLNLLVQNVYGGSGVDIAPAARREISQLTELGFADLPICMAKTQYSFSDNPQLRGAPRDFQVHVRHIKVNAGAGFLVAYSGSLLTMPGLPKVPAANSIDVAEDGRITGLS